MIEVKSYEKGGRFFIEHSVTCPKCGIEDKFCSTIYSKCSFCCSIWPPIEKILKSVDYRKTYHISGE